MTKMHPPHIAGSSFEDSSLRAPGHSRAQGASWREELPQLYFRGQACLLRKSLALDWKIVCCDSSPRECDSLGKWGMECIRAAFKSIPEKVIY